MLERASVQFEPVTQRPLLVGSGTPSVMCELKSCSMLFTTDGVFHHSCYTFKSGSSVDDDLTDCYLMLDPQLQPVPPDDSCQQSMQIFQEHKNLAQEYFKVTTQIAYLSNHMKELAERLSLTAEDQESLTAQEDEEVRKLESEKESLVQLHRNLTRQLELLKGRRGEQRADDSQRTNAQMEDGGGGGGWVYVPNHPNIPHSHPHPPNPHPT